MLSSVKKSPQKFMAFDDFAKERFSQLKTQHPTKNDKEIMQLAKQQYRLMTNTKSSAKIQANLQVSNSQDQVDIRAKQRLVFSEKKIMKKENKREEIKEESERFSESSSIKATPIKKIKSKAIKKTQKVYGQTEYLKFAKFYKEKLESEHPKWTKAQIYQIVQLLWRKSKLQRKSGVKSSKRVQKLRGPLAYFGYIKRNEGFSNEQISQLWKTLPKQTKKYYAKMGQGKQPFEASPVKETIFSKSSISRSTTTGSISNNNLLFLNKVI